MNISDLISVLEGFKEINVNKVYLQDYQDWKPVIDFEVRILKDENGNEEIALALGY